MHSLCNLKYSVPKKIHIASYNGSNYDYHFILKELGEEFEKQFTFLGESTEKYITFTVPIEKEVARIDKNGEATKNISYRLQVINTARFMACSLSNVVNNLSEGIHKTKCKYRHYAKKCKTCGIKYKYCDCFLEYTNFKKDLIEYKCFCCNKNYQQKFDEKLKKRFFNIYKFSNHNNNRLFNYYEKVFTLGKNSMKHHCLKKKKIFIVT